MTMHTLRGTLNARRAERGIMLAALLLCCSPAVFGQAAGDATLNVGDLVYVDVYRRPELSTTATVDAAGKVEMPYVGAVNVAGATAQEASMRVSAALSTILKNPRVTVSKTGAPMAMTSAPRAANMKTQVVTLNNLSAETISETLQGMTSEGGSINFEPSSNTLIITDTPATIQNIIAAVGQIDQLQTQVTQVRIETHVAEIREGALKDVGIRWWYKGDQNTGGYYAPPGTSLNSASGTRRDTTVNEAIGGLGTNNSSIARRFVDEPRFDRRLNVPVQIPVAGQMFFGVLNNNFDIGAMLDALVSDNQAELLANPSILAVNHTPAEIRMTDEYPYTEASQTFGGQAFSVKFMDIGIKLLVTPHVYRDSGGAYVKMELKPEVSFPTGVANGVPIRSVRSTDSVGIVRDNQTLAIGGIIMNDERKAVQAVPGFGKLPLLGPLFRRKENEKSRNELMVFVTPSIHESPEAVAWDRTISLKGSAKEEVPVVPLNETLSETRKE